MMIGLGKIPPGPVRSEAAILSYLGDGRGIVNRRRSALREGRNGRIGTMCRRMN
jgi:hypothetical protein